MALANSPPVGGPPPSSAAASLSPPSSAARSPASPPPPPPRHSPHPSSAAGSPPPPSASTPPSTPGATESCAAGVAPSNALASKCAEFSAPPEAPSALGGPSLKERTSAASAAGGLGKSPQSGK
ncbi:uncharacterized protein [Hetaerina americana]|uniref:uncharacterized protein n=1 Tax=Hetaerina americana TaxID=62018 RepID=UPI003A7F345E